MELSEVKIRCPYCGEALSILVDPSVAQQSYVEDCQVCCQPMVIWAEIDAEGGTRALARREDET